MVNIYCVVLLKDTNRTLIVEHHWVTTLSNARDLEYGVKKSIERKIFYSKLSQPANFDLPIRDDFDENIDACYIGYILKLYGKY